MKYDLPVYYSLLSLPEKREVRQQYIEEQKGLCFFCKHSLEEEPPKKILSKKINWKYFPGGITFLKHPIHLQHDHQTGLTEGAVHAYCNAVWWQYYGR